MLIPALATAAPSVSSVLTDIGSVVTQAMTWATNVAQFIAETPIVLIFVAVSMVGLGVGLIKRMISV